VLTAGQIITRANQIAKASGMASQGLDGLNIVLGGICQNEDFALARGLFQFNFNPSLITLFGSGPYPLPLDYLRTSGSSGAEGVTKSAWFLYPAPTFPSGQPMPLVPIDLGEFDQYPQLNAQGLPSVIATDMGGPLTQRIILATTASLSAGSTAGTVGVSSGLYNGLSMAGEGVQPGTTITVSGSNITLSLPATGTSTTASVFFGIAPVAYVYPAPVGPYPVSIRYQRMMPDIFDTSRYPWFPDEDYLIEKLAALMMPITGDTRRAEFDASAEHTLGKYKSMVDDTRNRAQTVQMDARRYGNGSGRALRITKASGW
jgi:hypothetical protein